MKRRTYLLTLTAFIFSCQTYSVSREQYASVYFNLANAYRELDKKDEALKAYYQALQIDPSMNKNAFNFAQLLIEKNRYDEALTLLKSLEKTTPQNTMILDSLAYVYYLKGDFSQSASYYKKILAINPLHENALFNSALLYEALDQPEEAFERLVETLPFLEETSDALKKIALLAYEIGRYDEALKYMNDYLAKKSDDSSIQWEYARILAKTKDFKKAAEIYDKLDTESNTNGELIFERAEVYLLGLESFEKGKEILARAIEKEFWDTDRLYALATTKGFLYSDEVIAYLKKENLFFDPKKQRLAAVRAVDKRRALAEEAKRKAQEEKAKAEASETTNTSTEASTTTTSTDSTDEKTPMQETSDSATSNSDTATTASPESTESSSTTS